MFLNLYFAVGHVISCCLPGFLMRAMVFPVLGTNQQVITLHSLALPDRLPLELCISGMVLGESPGCRLGAPSRAGLWEGEAALSEAQALGCCDHSYNHFGQFLRQELE